MAEPATLDGGRRMLITASVMLASVMQVLDITIANVALPHIQGSLSATQDQMAWVLTSYIVASAIATPLSGWLAGQVGRKRVILYSIAGFTIASMLCGLAHTLPEMVLARIIQGACGASLVPMSQAVMLDINPPEKHARAMTVWVTGITLGPIIGPALGGLLTESYNWRWVFYINAPLGILAFIGTLWSLPESGTSRSRFDFFGFATLSVAVGAVQILLDRGQLQDWFSSTEIMVEAAVAALATYLLIVHLMTSREKPFVEPALFKDWNFIAGCILMFVVGLVVFAALALLPPMLQGLMNYPVITTGLVTAPRGAGGLVAMFLVWKLSGRVDTRLVYVPLAGAAFATFAADMRNEGAAIFSLIRNLGSSVGISMAETLLTRNTQIAHAALAEHVSPFGSVLRERLPGAIANAPTLVALNAQVTRQAAMVAYIDDFKCLMWLAIVALPLVLLLRKRAAAEDVEQQALAIE